MTLCDAIEGCPWKVITSLVHDIMVAQANVFQNELNHLVEVVSLKPMVKSYRVALIFDDVIRK